MTRPPHFHVAGDRVRHHSTRTLFFFFNGPPANVHAFTPADACFCFTRIGNSDAQFNIRLHLSPYIGKKTRARRANEALNTGKKH
jgi:hypothetical protein